MSAEERAEALIDERELAAALRGLVPDPEAFRAGVERRIRAAREAQAAGDEREVRAADGVWWRRAAAWLPGELVPGSLAATGAKLSWKALPGLLVLPALTFAMLVMPLFVALGTLTGSGARAQQREAAVRSWWHEHKGVALWVLALIGLLFLRQPASAGVALLLCSTAVLALLLARLRAAGFARRAEVGRRCAHLLMALAFWMAVFGGPWRTLFPDERAARLAFSALALGGVVCAWVALREDYGSLWRLLTRSNGEDAALLLTLALLAPWSASLLWGSFADERDLDDQARHVEALSPEGFDGWDHARKATVWLRNEGVEPELARLRSYWRERRSDDDGTAGLLAAGIELGFVGSEELAALAADARPLLREEGPIQGASLRERADLLALVRAGGLGEEERDVLARRLLASREAGAQPWRIQRFATVVALLDELGRTGLAGELRTEAHALLRECWVPPRLVTGRSSGFIARPWHPDSQAFVPHTHDAIDLMLRFGVPDGIDLVAVLRGLERDGRHGARTGPELGWEASLALAKLERGLLPEPGPLGLVSANRVLLAILVLAGFCIAATLRAPREPRTASPSGGTT
jgi:hypothetical protein